MAFDLKTAVPAKETEFEGEKYVIPTKPFDLKTAVPVDAVADPVAGKRTFDLDARNAQTIAREEAAIDLEKKQIQNADGSVSTEKSMTVDIDGRAINIATIMNGVQMGDEEAVQLALSDGSNILGSFDTREEAVAAAQKRSNDIGIALQNKWEEHGEYRAIPRGEWSLPLTPEEVRRNKGRAVVQMAYQEANMKVPDNIKFRWWLDDKQKYVEKGLEVGALALGGWGWVGAKLTYDTIKNTFVGAAKGEKPSFKGALTERNIRESERVQHLANNKDFTNTARQGLKLLLKFSPLHSITPLDDFVNKKIDSLSGGDIIAGAEEMVDLAIPMLLAGIIRGVGRGVGEKIDEVQLDLARADLRPKVKSLMEKKGSFSPDELENEVDKLIIKVAETGNWNPKYVEALRGRATRKFWGDYINGKFTDQSGKALIPEFNLPPGEIKKIGKETVSGAGVKLPDILKPIKTPTPKQMAEQQVKDRVDFEVAQQKLVDEIALGKVSAVEKRKLEEKLTKLRSDYTEKLARQKETQKVKQKELTARQKKKAEKELIAAKKKKDLEIAKQKKEVAAQKAKADFEVATQKAIDDINFGKKGAAAKRKIVDKLEAEKIADKRKALAARANKLRKTKLIGDYNERLNSLLDEYDLGNRTEGTKLSREKRKEYLDTLDDLVDISVLGKGFFKGIGTHTLDEMTLLELEKLESQIEAIVHAAKTKDKLIRRKEAKEEAVVIDNILNKIESITGYRAGPTTTEGAKVSNVEKAGKWRKLIRGLRGYNAALRKAEFVADNLGIAEHLTDPIIVESADMNRRLMSDVEMKVQEIFKAAGKTAKNWDKGIKIPGLGKIKVKVNGQWEEKYITNQQAIGVALNSGNADNIRSLIEGNEFTPDEVKIIRDYVMNDPEMSKLVEGLWGTMEYLRPFVAEAFENKTGVKFTPVEGKYFPKMYDRTLTDLIQLNSNLVDMYAATIHSADVRFGSTIERTDASGALNLNFLEPLYFNIMRAIKYATHTNNVDYVNKVLQNKAVKDALIGSMNEETFMALETWLQRAANPFIVQKSQLEGFVNYMRYATSQFFLGGNESVMAVQALSIFDTIDEIGLLSTLNGIRIMYGNILIGNNQHKEVMDSSSYMRDRYSNGKFNRELSDMVNGDKLAHLTKGRKDLKQLYYTGIMIVDYLTTMPSWLGAKARGMRLFKGDETAANEYADKKVRRSQPDSSIENMATMLSGNAYQKLLTTFMSYTSVHHNQLADIGFLLFKNKELAAPRRVRDALVSFWWLALPGGLLYHYIKKAMAKEDTGPRKSLRELSEKESRDKKLAIAKNITGGMPFVRDIMQGVNTGRVDMDISAFTPVEYAIGAATKDDKTRDLVYLFGLFSKLYPKSVADFFLNKYDNKVSKRPE